MGHINFWSMVMMLILLGDVTYSTGMNTEALLDINKEVGLGVNTDKKSI
jgi:hypothetical protein